MTKPERMTDEQVSLNASSISELVAEVRGVAQGNGEFQMGAKGRHRHILAQLVGAETAHLRLQTELLRARASEEEKDETIAKLTKRLSAETIAGYEQEKVIQVLADVIQEDFDQQPGKHRRDCDYHQKWPGIGSPRPDCSPRCLRDAAALRAAGRKL